MKLLLYFAKEICFYDFLSYVAVFKWQLAIILQNTFPQQFVSTRWQEASCWLSSISTLFISMLSKLKKLLQIFLQFSAFIMEKSLKWTLVQLDCGQSIFKRATMNAPTAGNIPILLNTEAFNNQNHRSIKKQNSFAQPLKKTVCIYHFFQFNLLLVLI